MTASSFIPFILMYPLMLAGDGCILIAIALVATTGGNAWVCGAAFAAFHALYSISGILLASEIAEYSETLGGIIVLIGSLILLKHFVHHRLHHGAHGDCSCEHHPLTPVSNIKIISTAGALSIHALAAGPLLSQMSGITHTGTLTKMLLFSSCFIGLVVATIVRVGETRRATIMRFLDSLPGVVSGALAAVCFYALFHVIEHAAELPSWGVVFFIIVALGTSCSLGYWMHCRATPRLIHLSTRVSKR